mmetsp:Transcript_21601/g.32008  ORF Transcript_21601/g.32008 Transcript_21601/m.32008 type:complete len:372 (+) Transcript_21601:35-1150(+)
MATETVNHDENEIKQIIDQLFHHRKAQQVKEADQLKKLLFDQYSVQVFYRRNGSIGWRFICSETKEKGNALSHRDSGKRVVWSLVSTDVDSRPSHSSSSGSVQCDDGVSFVIATVDTPTYRSRLAETLDHLSLTPNNDADDTRRFHPIDVVDLLILEQHRSIGTNRILYEGWRQILLPKILNEGSSQRMILVGEDDIRLVASPSFIEKVCLEVFDSNPDLHVLSLGHAYSPAKPKRPTRDQQEESELLNDVTDDDSEPSVCGTPILEHLKRGKGIHATTLLAVRYPEGVKSLLETLESVPLRKRGHFDQFLFQSTLHSLNIAVSDPPLVGWAEVEHTLTGTGSGNRRSGGGRFEQLPQASVDVKWVRRNLI